MLVTETIVRIGELAASSAPAHVLVVLGIGSCIGLALVDRRVGIAGLAHVVLPRSQGHIGANRRKFADLAVPELVHELQPLGRIRLDAALVGGASMFKVSAAGLEGGHRNEVAVREALDTLRIPVAATATGGRRGRTVRVDGAGGGATVREAGGKEGALLAGNRQPEVAA
jgi:chemotaxis protein CheD